MTGQLNPMTDYIDNKDQSITILILTDIIVPTQLSKLFIHQKTRYNKTIKK